jgi:hypothetical protein
MELLFLATSAMARIILVRPFFYGHAAIVRRHAAGGCGSPGLTQKTGTHYSFYNGRYCVSPRS